MSRQTRNVCHSLRVFAFLKQQLTEHRVCCGAQLIWLEAGVLQGSQGTHEHHPASIHAAAAASQQIAQKEVHNDAQTIPVHTQLSGMQARMRG